MSGRKDSRLDLSGSGTWKDGCKITTQRGTGASVWLVHLFLYHCFDRVPRYINRSRVCFLASNKLVWVERLWI